MLLFSLLLPQRKLALLFRFAPLTADGLPLQLAFLPLEL